MNTALTIDGIAPQGGARQQTPLSQTPPPRQGSSFAKLPEGEKPKRSKKKMIGIIVLLVVLWLLIAQVLAADRYEAVVNVVEGENKIGINPTTERLDFGDISRTNAQSRFVSIKNNGRMGKFIFAVKTGSIADIMTIKERSLTIVADEEKKLEFTVFAPVSAPLGNYSGTIWVFKLPKPF